MAQKTAHRTVNLYLDLYIYIPLYYYDPWKLTNGFHKCIGLSCCKVVFKRTHAKPQIPSYSVLVGCWQSQLYI